MLCLFVTPLSEDPTPKNMGQSKGQAASIEKHLLGMQARQRRPRSQSVPAGHAVKSGARLARGHTPADLAMEFDTCEQLLQMIASSATPVPPALVGGALDRASKMNHNTPNPVLAASRVVEHLLAEVAEK